MDITTLVRSITGAFEDAASLVKRIRERQNEKDEPEAAQDLLTSLSLGPVVVRGYYDSDVKRFGDPYAVGDHLAREQMKDVLINLQMTLLTTLRTVLLDDKELDYAMIQSASDDCRVNAGVSLGQLSQRLSENARMYSLHPPSYTSGGSHMSPPTGLHYSSSQSTHSSSGTRRIPLTPEWNSEQFSRLGIGVNRPYLDRQMSTSSSGSQAAFSRRGTDASISDAYYSSHMPQYSRNAREDEEMSLRRPSSHTLAPEDSVLLSPTRYTTNDSHSSPPQFPDRNSYGSNISTPFLGVSNLSRDGSYHSHGNRSLPEDHNIPRPLSAIPFDSPSWTPSEPRQSNSSYAVRAQDANHSTLEHVSSLETARENDFPRPLMDRSPGRSDSFPNGPARKPVPLPYPSDHSGSQQTPMPLNMPARPSISAPIPVESELTPTLPTRAPRPTNGNSSLSPTSTVHSNNTRRTDPNSFRSSPFPPRTGPLNLPNESNQLGFCKGAFRLFAGMDKKAFSAANRPVGYASMIPYWRCGKCLFEGPMSTFINPNAGKKAKPEKTFDPTIRIDHGIRYKWIFLAKCHVNLKTIPEGKRDGSFGSFACIFCCAEGGLRNWNSTGDVSSVNGSNRTSTSSASAINTPIFGNLHSFIDHLQMHRIEAGWPNAEMQGRMKCVVGRIADKSEDFEVNFMPLADDEI